MRLSLLALLGVTLLAGTSKAVVTQLPSDSMISTKKFLQTSAGSKVASAQITGTTTTSTGKIYTYGGYTYVEDTQNPFAEFIIGVIMITFSFPILWNNERKQVKIAALLKKAEEEAVDVIDYKKPEDTQNFKLLYASGQSKNDSILEDEKFGIQVKNAVKLVRRVEMYQWVEQTERRNNVTEYHYRKEWRSSLLSSGCFRDGSKTNPSSMPFNNHSVYAQKVEFGGYILSQSQLNQFTQLKSVELSDERINIVRDKIHDQVKENGYKEPTRSGEFIFLKKHDHLIPDTDVGDIRIAFDYVPCGDTTIMAQQIVRNNQYTFRQWNPKKSNCPVEESNDPDHETVCLLCACCPCARVVDSCFQSIFKETIEIVDESLINRKELIGKMQSQNDTTTALIRLGGWGLQYLGICLLFSPIIYGLSWIPLVGYLMAGGFKFIVAIFAFVVSVTLTSLTISLAWLYYRPLYGLCLLGVVAIGVSLILFL
ncbi:transmembrane protein 43 [Stylonychia lemnae]|uniref:Transmembrane protein 43 n=1 Tax=Stylonychia lemnae TaxID=5949 RepID=A0A078B3I3_STYLE|nr:transmembrane protein 43 [Stylonychia lemnae]|eukprot:CDW88063.1 transmembrane protein 43 [Stylonychia lemnae]